MSNEEKYQDRLRKLIDYQKKNSPWPPSTRDIAVLWGLSGASAAIYYLNGMVERGDAIFRQRGARSEFYAVERQNA